MNTQNQISTVNSVPLAPYVGMRPFEQNEQAIFFGRDMDAALLRDKVFSARLTVFYGSSGVGKSSILRTLLVPHLEAQEARVIYFDDWRAEDPTVTLKARLVEEATKLKIPDAGAGGPKLTDLVRLLISVDDRTVVLILDQFEEFFTAHGDRIDPLRKELADLVRTPGLDVRVLLSLREEHIASLELFRVEILNLFQSTDRLEPLNAKSIQEAIEGPARLFGLDYEPALVTELVSDLRQDQRGAAGKEGAAAEAPGDLPLLQLVCDELWKEVKKLKQAKLTRGLYHELGGRQGILDAYLRRVMPSGWSAQVFTAQLMRYLAPPDGHKVSFSANHLAGLTEFPVDRIRAELGRLSGSDVQVLRSRQYGESKTLYELWHDSFIRIIEPWRDDILRRYKYFRWGTIAGSIVMVGAIIGGLFLIDYFKIKDAQDTIRNKNNEITKARDKAEELIGVLIGEDLMEMIRPVGRTEITEYIQKKVEDYVDKMPDKDDSSLSSRRNRGLVLVNKGDLYLNQGKLKDAQDNYEKARDIFNKLIQQEPNNPNNMLWQRDLATAISKLGEIAGYRWHLRDALTLHERALDIRNQLTAKSEIREQVRREIAGTKIAIAGILLKQRHISKSMGIYDEIIKSMKPSDVYSQEAKKWLYILQDAFTGKGIIYFLQGNDHKATEAVQTALEKAKQAVYMSPLEPDARIRLGQALFWSINYKEGWTPREVLDQYQEAHKFLEETTRWDPSNAHWLREKYAMTIKIGNANNILGKSDDALDSFKKALSEFEKLVNIDVSNADWLDDLAWVHREIAEVLAQKKQMKDALFHYDSASKIRETLAKNDLTNNSSFYDLASLYMTKANALRSDNKLDEALKTYQRAVSTMKSRQVTEPTDAEFLYMTQELHRESGVALVKKKDFNGAKTAFTQSENALLQLIKLKDDNARYWFQRFLLFYSGVAPLRREQENQIGTREAYREALAAVKKAVDLAPKQQVYLSWLSWTYQEIGDSLRDQSEPTKALDAYAQAEKALRQAIKLEENAYYWNRLYELLYSHIEPLRTQQKDPSGGREAYRDALAALEKVVNLEEPKKPVNYVNLSSMYQTIGGNLRDQREPEKALAAYAQAEEALRQAIELKEDADDWNRFFLLLYDHVAPLRTEQKDQAGALKAYRDALSAVQKASELEPKESAYRANLSYVHQQIGDSFRDQGELEKALAAYAQAEEAVRQAIKLKEDAGYWNQFFLLLYYHVAPLRTKQKDQAGALKAYREALLAVEKASDLEPKEPVYRANLSYVHQKIGDGLREQGVPEKALAAYAQAVEALRQAIKLKEDAHYWNRLCQLFYQRIAPLHAEQKNQAGTLKAYRDALSAVEKASDLEPKEPVYRANLSYVHQKIGDGLREQGVPEKALAAYAQAVEALRQAIKLKEEAGYWNELFLLLFDSIAPLRTEQKDQVGALKSYRDALLAVEKASDLEPKESVYRANLSYVHQKIGDSLREQGVPEKALAAYARAEEALRQAIKLKEDARYWNELFLLLFDSIAPLRTEQKDQAGALKAYRDALSAVEKAVDLEPQNRIYKNNLDTVRYKFRQKKKNNEI